LGDILQPVQDLAYHEASALQRPPSCCIRPALPAGGQRGRGC